MLCAKCQQDKQTPVVYKDKLYCLGCAIGMIEEAREREERVIAMQEELSAARASLKEAEDQIVILSADLFNLACQRDELVRQIGEVEQKLHEQEGNRLSALNHIDKLTADLENSEKEER